MDAIFHRIPNFSCYFQAIILVSERACQIVLNENFRTSHPCNIAQKFCRLSLCSWFCFGSMVSAFWIWEFTLFEKRFLFVGQFQMPYCLFSSSSKQFLFWFFAVRFCTFVAPAKGFKGAKDFRRLCGFFHVYQL